MPSKNASSADNQQERSIKRMKITNSIIALVMAILGATIISDFIFAYFVDPFIVPLTGMRPVLAGITALACTYPAWLWIKNKPHI